MKNLIENQREIEKKWQKIWDEKKVFSPKIEKAKQKFFMTVPYPYANSVLHIGHGRGYTTPDIYGRFLRLMGKNVLFPMAYHISGTPVLAVSDAIKKNDLKQIKLTKEALSDYTTDSKEQEKILKSFIEPMNIAEYFSSTIEGSLKSIGIGIDWSRQFTTGDEIYKKFIEWQFKKLNEAGILIQGQYPILYSPKDKNAVGEDDIKDGDTDKVSVQEMSYILFQRKDLSDEYIAVATLRPDALFGTTNLWVDKDMDLIKIEKNSQKIIISKSSLIKFEHQFENIKILEEFKGEKLIGLKVITPITQKEVIIAQADFIDEKHGTGIVYSSPAGSPHDFIALIEAKKEARLPEDLEVINTVETFDKKGNKINFTLSCPAEDKIKKYNIKSSKDEDKLELAKQELYKEEHFGGKLNSICGEFNGVPIKIAKEKVQKKLEELKLGGVLYETSRRAITRGGDEVIVANLKDQWFLNYSEEKIKQKALELLEEMDFQPNKLKDTQKGYINWVSMRPCARRRGIGTPLPFDKKWVIESLSDSTIYQMLYLIQSILLKEKISPNQLEPSVFDYIYLNIGNPVLISEESSISINILQQLKEQVDYWKNVDFRYTAVPHMSNHLSFMIYHYSLIFPKKNWPKNITIGGMLIKDGAKISKSSGNGLPLIRVGEKYGVDLYRLYIATASNYDSELDFRDEDIFQVEKKFQKFKELIINSFSKELKTFDEFSNIDKWLIGQFYIKVKQYIKFFENLRIREAFVCILYEFLNDIAYHQRRTNPEQTLEIIRFIADDYLKVMAPATPHICEELYTQLGFEEFISISTLNTNLDFFIDNDIIEIENIVKNIILNISALKEVQNKKEDKLNSVIIQIAPTIRFEIFDLLKKLLKENKEFKYIISILNEKFPTEKKFISKFVPKTLGSGLSAYLEKDKEKNLYLDLKIFIKKEFDLKLEIQDFKDEVIPLSLTPSNPLIFLK